MLANTARLLLVTAAVTFFATSADAQEIQPRCAKVKDKVKCTCFFTNGGLVERGSAGAWRMRIYSAGQMGGYIACMKRYGRANG